MGSNPTTGANISNTMIQNIYINFLPGSAGNFLSRALQLAIPNSCCWLNNDSTVPASPMKKFLTLSYDKNNQFNNWLAFEQSISHYSEVENFKKLEEFIFINLSHLYKISDIDLTNSILIQIDIKNKKIFEWAMFNCLYKHSRPREDYFKTHKFNKINNKNLIEIDLENFFSWQDFKIEIEKILKIIDVDTTKTNWKLVNVLYNQWWDSTLKFEDFESYKKDIGWIL